MLQDKEVDLTAFNTLRCQAVAREVFWLDAIEEVQAVPTGALWLGEGSNVVFASTYIEQAVARWRTCAIDVIAEDKDSVLVRVEAGHNWHDWVVKSVAQGWQGLENLALIPGTVGAAPIQNIGAYGVEVAQFIEAVEVFDAQMREYRVLSKDACGFAYRESNFKHQWRDWVVLAVQFRLNKKPKLSLIYHELAQKRELLTSADAVLCEVMRIRRQKLPALEAFPNVGSFFHNPVISATAYAQLNAQYPEITGFAVEGAIEQVKLSAAKLIELAGLRGVERGGVSMSAQHALVLVNHGATGAQVLAFAEWVADSVWQKFAVRLSIEPTVV